MFDMGYFWSLRSDLGRHTVLSISLSFTLVFNNDTCEKSRHYVLANLHCWFGVDAVIEEWLKQTRCFSCFTKINFGCCMILPVQKIGTICDLSYCVDCRYIRSLKSDFCRYTLISVSLRFILFLWIILPVKNADTMCSLISCVCWGTFGCWKVI